MIESVPSRRRTPKWLAPLIALAISLGISSSAPAAQAGDFIQTPSGNIICQLGDDGIYCVIFSLMRDVTIRSSGSVGVTGRRGDPGDAPNRVVRYGTSVTASGVRCTSRVTGLTCVSTRNGRGAKMSRAGVQRI